MASFPFATSAGARSKVLPVPYFTQPTGITCQSTCLKMFASYLEQHVVFQSTGAAARDILQIWKDINEDPRRPSKLRNAHKNMQWWLEMYFPRLKFEYWNTTDEGAAFEKIVRAVDGAFPVLMSVSHARVAGHIVLIVGYENWRPNQSSIDSGVVMHDPYGRFDPTLASKLFGKRRFDEGMCLVGGGEVGPGKGVRVPITSAARQRAGDKMLGTYYLLTGSR
jgi:hypothetical protein